MPEEANPDTEHKDQHWIPRSYLRAWCDPGSKQKVVHRYSPKGDYIDWRAYTKVASEDDLYTIFNDARRDVRVETVFLHHIENRFAAAVRTVEQGRPLPAAYKHIFAWYMAAMRNRSPAARDHWRDFQNRVVAKGDAMQRALDQMSPEQRKRYMRGVGSTERSRGKGMTLEEARAAAQEPFGSWLPRHIAIEAEHLHKLGLELLKAPPEVDFITSDSPVTWRNRALPVGLQGWFPGLRHPAIEMLLPLTPRWCLAFRHQGDDGISSLTEVGANRVNANTLALCDQFFVANSADLVIEWIERPK